MRNPVLRRTLGLAVLIGVTLGAQCNEKTTDPDATPPVMAVNAGNGQQAAVGAAVGIAPSVKFTNAAGTGVAGVIVNFAVASGGGGVTGTSQTTNAAGVATVGGWTMGTAIGANTLIATGPVISTGGPITFTATAVAGPAKNIDVNGGNNQSVVLGGAVATAPSVKITDLGGNPVSGTAVTFAIGTGGGTLTGGTQTTNTSGIATVGSWTPGTLGLNTLIATSAGLSGSPLTLSATATVAPAARLVLTTAPSTTAANRVAFPTQPVVQVADASGNSVAQAGTVITASITSGGGTLGGTATATTNASGAATFSGLSISGTAGGRTLSFAATGLTAVTAPVTTTAGAAAAVAIEAGNNQSIAAGSAVVIPPAVKVTDADGNSVNGFAVDFAVTSGGGSITLPTANTNSNGFAVVGSWTLGTTPGVNTITATATGLTGSPVTFTATGTIPTGLKLSLTTSPGSSAQNRVAFGTQPVVQLRDAANAVFAQAGVVVTAAITAGGGTLGGTTTATTNASGVASFTNLSIAGTVGARTLTFTATNYTSITAAVTTTAGQATALAIELGNNQTTVVGATVAVRPAVKVTDADGNGVNGFGVGFAVASGGGSITGATTNTNATGVATVGSWTLGTTPGVNTMTATAAGLTGSPVTFTATGATAVGTILSLTTPPSSSAQNRVAFGTQPVVQLRDAANGLFAQAGVVVTAAITAGGGTLGGTTTATTNASGVATFTNLSIAGTVGARTLTFSAPSYTSIAASVTTTPGAAATIAVEANNNQSAAAGGALALLPSVKVTDADANGVQGVAVTFAVATGGGSGTGLSQTTNGFGVAAPGTWTLGATPGANTMTATSAGLTGSPVTLTATGTSSVVNLNSVSPSLLTPGVTATLIGTGFSATMSQNAVTIDGVAAAVTAATPTQLTVTIPTTLPCEATHNATISLSVNGSSAVTIAQPLQVATARTLAVGQSVIVTAASEQRCNELSNTGTSRYLVAVSNTSTTYSTTGAAFTLRGAAGSGAAGLDPLNARQALSVQARNPVARRPRVQVASTPADDADRMHLRVLEQNIRHLNETRGRFPRTRSTTNLVASSLVLNENVSLNIPNLNNSNICTLPYAMNGRVVYVGTRSIIIEDNLNPMAGTIDATYTAVGTEFDNVMFPILTTNYGDPLARDAVTDNNQRIIMVFSRRINESMSGIGGFVVSCDFTARNATTNTQSNFGEYFYARAPMVPGTSLSTVDSPAYWLWTMRGTIIHEVKHITSFAEHIARGAGFEESWLEESTARLSEELYERAVYSFAQKANIGYGTSSNQVGPYCGVRGCGGRARGIVRVFEELAQKWYTLPEEYSPLGRIDASDFSFYATGWSLVRWAIDQSSLTEAAFLRALTQEPSLTGVANLTARSGRSFVDILPEWSLAMALDDYPGFVPAGSTPASGRMRQLSWNHRDVFAGYKLDFPSVGWPSWPFNPFTMGFGPFSIATSVRAGTAAIFEMSGTASAKQLLELKAQSGTGAAPSELRIAIVRVQ